MSETRRPDELSQFASDLQLMRHRAINLRLYATGERLDWATRMAGFEIAGDYEGCSRYEAAQAAPRNFQTVLSAQGRVQTAALLRSKWVPTGEVGTTPKLIVPSVEISSSALGIDGHRRGSLK